MAKRRRFTAAFKAQVALEAVKGQQTPRLTSADFTGRLGGAGVRISIETMAEAEAGLQGYSCFHNEERPHQTLGYRTPAAVYRGATGSVPAPAA